MTISKQIKRQKREWIAAERMSNDLKDSLEGFRKKIHEMLLEPMGGCLAAYHPRINTKSAGHKVRPFVSGVVPDPIEPIKLKKGVKLVIEDESKEFKEPIVSPKMQKNLRILELRLDNDGHLYSPKAFDPEWNWQTQALWFRLIGMGYADIVKKVDKSLNTVKSMFKRLKLSKFYPPVHHWDWATIGYGAENTPSGWRMILMGGASGLLNESDEMIIDERSGQIRPKYRVNVHVGEEITLETKPFNLKKHRKEVKEREKEAKTYKEQVEREQRVKEIETLEKNVKKGFNPKTGKYKND